jgi:hypothetical protein
MEQKMKKELYNDLRKNPIDRAKYVRDSVKTGSKAKAVLIQRPDIPPATANVVANRLEKTEVVQKLRENMDGRIMRINKKRLNKMEKLIESENEKIALGAVAEAGKTVRDYEDRRAGKATQRIEKTSKKLIVKVSMNAPNGS